MMIENFEEIIKMYDVESEISKLKFDIKHDMEIVPTKEGNIELAYRKGKLEVLKRWLEYKTRTDGLIMSQREFIYNMRAEIKNLDNKITEQHHKISFLKRRGE